MGTLRTPIRTFPYFRDFPGRDRGSDVPGRVFLLRHGNKFLTLPLDSFYGVRPRFVPETPPEVQCMDTPAGVSRTHLYPDTESSGQFFTPVIGSCPYCRRLRVTSSPLPLRRPDSRRTPVPVWCTPTVRLLTHRGTGMKRVTGAGSRSRNSEKWSRVEGSHSSSLLVVGRGRSYLRVHWCTGYHLGVEPVPPPFYIFLGVVLFRRGPSVLGE